MGLVDSKYLQVEFYHCTFLVSTASLICYHCKAKFYHCTLNSYHCKAYTLPLKPKFVSTAHTWFPLVVYFVFTAVFICTGGLSSIGK